MTIACPLCRQVFTVPTEVVQVDTEAHVVLCRMDRSELYGHMQACAAVHGDRAGADLVNGEPTKAVALPPLAQPHDVPPLSGGRRTCVMCGVPNGECMDRLRRSRKGCCPACESGNTHPAPQDSVPCSVWAGDRA